MLKGKWMLLAVGVIAWGVTAESDIIYDNGMPNLTNAIASDVDAFGNEVADSFVLAPGQNTILDVHWWGIYAYDNTPPEHDDFVMRFFEDDGGKPGAQIVSDMVFTHANRADTGMNLPGIEGAPVDLYEYSLDIMPLTLTPGLVYYISIVNDTTWEPDNWYWASSGDELGVTWSRSGAGEWIPRAGSDVAFRLTGAIIPEPATMSLLGLGIVCLIIGRARRTL